MGFDINWNTHSVNDPSLSALGNDRLRKQAMSQTPNIQSTASGTTAPIDGTIVHSAFDRMKHVSDGELESRAMGMLIVSIQTGKSPAVVTMEMNPVGKLSVYDAKFAPNASPEQLGGEEIMPTLKNRHQHYFANRHFVLLMPHDQTPEIMANAWITQLCVFMNEFNETFRFIPRNMQIQGLAAADRFMRAPVGISFDNMPKLVICSQYACDLIDVIEKDYRYVVDGKGDHVPGGTDKAINLAAAFHYGCLFAEHRGPIGPSDHRARPIVME